MRVCVCGSEAHANSLFGLPRVTLNIYYHFYYCVVIVALILNILFDISVMTPDNHERALGLLDFKRDQL